jgi:hypothetical protein
MQWIKKILETNPKNRNKHVIRGIALIDSKYYYLDYIVFTEFNWWCAYEIENIDNYDINEIKKQKCDLFFDSLTNKFVSLQQLPEGILNNYVNYNNIES